MNIDKDNSSRCNYDREEGVKGMYEGDNSRLVEEFRKYVDDFLSLPDDEREKLALEMFEDIGVIDSEGNVQEFFKTSFKKKEK